jgi:GAF domain-containing protein
MVDQQRLQSALRRFASTLVRRYEVGDVLYRLSDTVSDVLGVTGSGVSVLDDGVLRFVTASSETVADVERLQDHFEQGPCKDAAATTTSVVINDLVAHRERWPKFAPAAVDHGLSAALGIPMHVDGTTVGALNVYDAAPRAWTDEEITAAQLLADMATAYIVMVGQLRSAEQLAEQLQHALNSRIVIEQAKGVLAKTHDIDVSVAFELLRRYARNHNRNLHQIAGEVVDGTLHL